MKSDGRLVIAWMGGLLALWGFAPIPPTFAIIPVRTLAAIGTVCVMVVAGLYKG